MTALRRGSPPFAPGVSSRGVGTPMPLPTPPRGSRISQGSTFPRRGIEKKLPRGGFAKAAPARLRTLGRRLGSTCFSRAGIAGFSSIRAGAGNLAASAAFSAQARDGFAEVADRVAGLVLLSAQHFDVALEFRYL